MINKKGEVRTVIPIDVSFTPSYLGSEIRPGPETESLSYWNDWSVAGKLENLANCPTGEELTYEGSLKFDSFSQEVNQNQ
jgi:hypothetical protein